MFREKEREGEGEGRRRLGGGGGGKGGEREREEWSSAAEHYSFFLWATDRGEGGMGRNVQRLKEFLGLLRSQYVKETAGATIINRFVVIPMLAV